MPFTVPNKADAAFADQAKLDNVDLDILALGMARTGIVSGCAVTAQGTPDTTVAVASGVAMVDGAVVTVAAGSVTGFTGDATHPRFDLVTVDNTGTKARVAGTAAANPAFPEVPANRVCLAAVYVPQSDTTVATNQITDKRVTVSANGAILGARTTTFAHNTSTAEVSAFSVTIPGGLLGPSDVVRMWLAGDLLRNGPAGTVNYSHKLSFGGTAFTSTVQGLASASPNRVNWSGYVDLFCLSTSSQRIGALVGNMQSSATNSFGPHSWVHTGQGAATEDTSTDKVLDWRFLISVSDVANEMRAHAGFVQLFKAGG